jgi:hypothetical protein
MLDPKRDWLIKTRYQSVEVRFLHDQVFVRILPRFE